MICTAVEMLLVDFLVVRSHAKIVKILLIAYSVINVVMVFVTSPKIVTLLFAIQKYVELKFLMVYAALLCRANAEINQPVKR